MTPTSSTQSTATAPPAPQPPIGRPHGLAVGTDYVVRGGFGRLGGVYRATDETTLQKLPINRKERRRRLKLSRRTAGAGPAR